MAPRVSVCLPVYNSERYLEEALDSVIRQSFSDIEIVVVDDGSTDGSGRIARSYASRDTRFRYFENEQTIGMVSNWNHCLELARGDYIRFLFGDDRFESPDALALMVAVLERNPTVSLVTSARTVIDDGSRVIKILARYGSRDRILDRGFVIKDALLEQRNCIGEPSIVMFRREQGMRGFIGRYRQFVDLEMWIHLLEQGDLAYIRKPLGAFRVHEQQASTGQLRENVHVDEQIELIRDYGEKNDFRLNGLERAYMRFVPAMNCWKLSRRHRQMAWEEGRKKIESLRAGGMRSFFLFLPVYRMYRIYYRLVRRWMIRKKGRELQ